METSRAAAEDPVFGQTGANNEVEVTRYAKPSGWTNNSTTSVSRLGNLAGHYIGPNTLQKVMAGDQVSTTVQYYYQSAFTNANPNIIPTILTSLASAIGGGATNGTLVHGNASAITTQLNGTPAFTTAVEPSSGTGSVPQAYLTILFFDERFNLIASADGGVAQQAVAISWTTSTPPLGLTNIKAPKNGYAYVYVSNRSDQDVYFDNLVVNITAGNIIEENHYYAFGLKISAISSKKLGDANEGKLSNPYQYNDKEMLDEDAGLGWQDYGFRNYDPQIGRFHSIDPINDRVPILSPYIYAFNDPIANIDKSGLSGEDIIGSTAKTAKTLGSITVRGIIHTIKPLSNFAKLAKVVTKAGLIINVARIASDLINIKILTPSVGDNLSEESLSSNPNFSGVGLGQLRGMIRGFNLQLQQWMINISAGILLEDIYRDFPGTAKEYSKLHCIFSKWWFNAYLENYNTRFLSRGAKWFRFIFP